jgi:uncharacterized protein
MMDQSILWQGIYLTGHEHCRVYSEAARWFLSGAAVFFHDHKPCRLEYLVECDVDWNTLAARVSGWVGERSIDVELTVDPDRNWRLNGVEQSAVKGCTDVDLNFSPSTNLLPIRRLSLNAGDQAQVRAAWLRFPSFELEPLNQVYHRIDESTYRYESGGGKFVAELKVNSAGLVTNYPGIWEEVK